MYPSSAILETLSQKKILSNWINVSRSYVYALPAENDGEKEIFYGRKMLTLTSWISRSISVQNTKPYDNAPGGFFPHLDELKPYTPPNSQGIKTYISLFHPYVDFIPTISALDLDHSINDLYYNPIIASQTPFDYIISTESISGNFEPGYEPTYPYSWNEQHSSITTEKRDFLINLIENNFPIDLYIQNKTLFTSTIIEPIVINATNSITAGNNVDINQTQGDVIITQGNNITFRAGTEINLEPGFEADYNFEAYIEPFETDCDPTSDYLTKLMNADTYSSVSNNANDKIKLKIDSSQNKVFHFLCIPNPNNGVFYIIKQENTNNSEEWKVEISNLLGIKIYQTDFETNTKSINISQYPKGIYIVKAYSGNNVFVEKVVYQ